MVRQSVPIERKRLAKILTLALPIMGGMVSQNVLNLIDTGMVGRVGEAALAAVGFAIFLTFLSQAFLVGLSSGVQAMVARRHGSGDDEKSAVPLNGGLLFAVALGLPVAAVLWLLAEPMMNAFLEDPAVREIALPYYRARLCAIVFVAANFSFRGYWNGVNKAQVYLRTLVIMHVVNIVLNYTLIFGHFGAPELGATGAGIGTAVSTALGTLLYFGFGIQHAKEKGFLQGLPGRETFRTILRISVPTAIQQTFFAGGLTLLMWIFSQVGTTEMAAASVLINIMLIGVLPGIGLGLAATSLVGQALGRNDIPDARRWGFEVMGLGMALILIVALPMIVFPEAILGLFIKEASTVAVGVRPLQIMGAFMAFDVAGLISMNALFGAGDTKRVAVVSIVMQWLLYLPLAYVVGPLMGGGLVAIWLLNGIYRTAQTGIFVMFWRGRKWEGIAV